mmetsp:Transcript_38774/g.102969  ORF Transcript_38774/g.102969 Transcript_38774/m.102969 type:complete len:268 (-) Transcript_38774:143-946(-)
MIRVSLLGHLILFSALVGALFAFVVPPFTSFTSTIADRADAIRRLSGSQYFQNIGHEVVERPDDPFVRETYDPYSYEPSTPAKKPLPSQTPDPLASLARDIVNIIVFMICAFVYKKKMLDPKPKLQEIAQNERGDFKHELFQCSKTPELALYGCCCAGCRAGDTYESAGIMGYWPIVVSFVCFPVCYACCMAPILRGKLRAKFGGRGVAMSDWFQSVCCLCCTIVQEANTVDDEAGVQAKCFLKLDKVEVTAPPTQVQLSSFQEEAA